MQPSSLEIFDLFIKPPADVLYFMVAIALSGMSWLLALSLRGAQSDNALARRYGLALSAVLLLWVAMVIGALYVQLTRQDTRVILPPLERLVSALGMLAVGWAFLGTSARVWERPIHAITLLLMALVIVGYIVTSIFWANDLATRASDFNLNYGVVWAFVHVVLSLLGVISCLLMARYIVDAPLKSLFFVFIAVGSGYHLAQGTLIGSYSGTMRLAYVLAWFIVPVVLYRLLAQELHAKTLENAQLQERVAAKSEPASAPAPRPALAKSTPVETQSALLFKTLGLILENASAASLPERIVKATLDVLRADVGLLLRVQDANYADVIYAYDKLHQQTISSVSLNLNQQPTLANAIERGAGRVLYPDRNREELEDFYTRLDIEKIGVVYFQPLMRGQDLKGVLVVSLPYAERELDRHEQELLKAIGIVATDLIALSDEAREARILAEERAIQAMVEGVGLSQLGSMATMSADSANLQIAREQIAELSKQVMQLKIQLDDERSRLASLFSDAQGDMTISQTVRAISEEQTRLREERDQLLKRLQEAEAALQSTSTTPDLQLLTDALERERQNLQEEKARLQAQLEELRAQANAELPQDTKQFVQQMVAEQARLERERDQLQDKLASMQSQLQALGISDGEAGLAQVLEQVVAERQALRVQNETLTRERDLLLAERARLEDAILHEKERDQRLRALQQELENVAGDRETAIKQRDKMRAELDDLKRKLDAVKEHRARLLAQMSGYEMERNELRDEQLRLWAELQAANNARSELTHVRDTLLAENQALKAEVDQLLLRLDVDKERLNMLNEDGVRSLQRMIQELSQSRNALEQELNQARAEINALKPKPPAHVASDSGDKPSNERGELFVSLVQELRTPLTSLIGYVDLLLNESAGILGEMQRKFLQRVSANISRLETMINDLISITQLEVGQMKLETMPVNIVMLIEESITNASIQFREKGLTIALNLTDDLPLLRADKDALEQVLGQLMTNAYLVSPPSSEIKVSAECTRAVIRPHEDERDVVLVSIEDRGGGIAAEDVPRVFSRKYRAENPLIQGLGDSGVGLSLAKTLVEAHHGRLWVETREGVGSKFSFVLPIEDEQG